MANYRNTPHSTTGEKPSKLLFNRDIVDKLPREDKIPRGEHHKNARRRDAEAKKKMKAMFDTKNIVRMVEIRVGDWAYRREKAPSTIKGVGPVQDHQRVREPDNRRPGWPDFHKRQVGLEAGQDQTGTPHPEAAAIDGTQPARGTIPGQTAQRRPQEVRLTRLG